MILEYLLKLSAVELAVLCGAFGLVVGSFLNVVVYRMPRIMLRHWARDAGELLADPDVQRENDLGPDRAPLLAGALAELGERITALKPLTLSTPRSSCPHCGHRIKVIENVPVLSWLALRARCSACHAPISPRYPVVEAAVGILFALAGLQFGVTPALAAALIVIGILVSLTLIDADVMLLPDGLTLSLLWLGLAAALFNCGFAHLHDAVLGAMVGYATFWIIGKGFLILRGIEGMGAGDYKLLAALGAWFGWQSLLPIVILSAGVGAIVGLTLVVLRRANMATRLPFGVYLAPAGLLMLFLGPQVRALLPGGH